MLQQLGLHAVDGLEQVAFVLVRLMKNTGINLDVKSKAGHRIAGCLCLCHRRQVILMVHVDDGVTRQHRSLPGFERVCDVFFGVKNQLRFISPRLPGDLHRDDHAHCVGVLNVAPVRDVGAGKLVFNHVSDRHAGQVVFQREALEVALVVLIALHDHI